MWLTENVFSVSVVTTFQITVSSHHTQCAQHIQWNVAVNW